VAPIHDGFRLVLAQLRGQKHHELAIFQLDGHVQNQNLMGQIGNVFLWFHRVDCLVFFLIFFLLCLFHIEFKIYGSKRKIFFAYHHILATKLVAAVRS
jgi:hypothetical protein